VAALELQLEQEFFSELLLEVDIDIAPHRDKIMLCLRQTWLAQWPLRFGQ
jgi:hypothetical protein